ncbi:MAG: hypothetical protein J6J36_03610 [Clostridia bacterium]|nr:hypothetical protein [Clostridia bacterium]
MPKFYNATEVANMMSYSYEIRRFMMKSRRWINMCITDIFENSTDTDTELRLNVSWNAVMQSVFVLNDEKQFCKWKQDRVVENRPFCKVCGKIPDVPKEIRGKTWKDIELPTSEDVMPDFVIGRMFLALKKELEADGFAVDFDFTKDHAPTIRISAKGGEEPEANANEFGYSPQAATNDSRFILEARRFISSRITDNMPDSDMMDLVNKVKIPVKALFDGIFETTSVNEKYVRWKNSKTSDSVPDSIKNKCWKEIVEADNDELLKGLRFLLEQDCTMKNRGFLIYVDLADMTISVEWTGHLIRSSDLFEGEKVLTEGSVADVGHIKK